MKMEMKIYQIQTKIIDLRLFNRKTKNLTDKFSQFENKQNIIKFEIRDETKIKYIKSSMRA